MIALNGIGVSRGIVSGKVFVKTKTNREIARKEIQSLELEIHRVENAKQQAINELQGLYEHALQMIGESEAQIFEVHQMMLEDEDFLARITEIIREERVNAEYAVERTKEEFAAIFTSMDDAYMQERAADIIDISNRLIDNLIEHHEQAEIDLQEPAILVAADLLPSDTVQIDRTKILGIITQQGGQTSHSSILARTMGIPAVVGVQNLLSVLNHGDEVMVDGESGEIVISPDPATKREWEQRKRDHERRIKDLQRVKGTASITKDGRKVKVAGNIGTPQDLAAVIENDGEGIGLFRSEFLYMNSDLLPSEEVQLAAYKEVLEGMKDNLVIIRTLDVGGDKEISYLEIPKEDNPFLGYRAIRVCLEEPTIFKTQLRALFRASIYGNLGIMFPMISTVEELQMAKALVEEVKADLVHEDIPFSPDVQIGMMIETPAAALISDQLAKEVDFFSIGTNDLTQYTIAVDRMNAKVAHLYDAHHLAVLRLIQLTIENGHREGIWVGICGEAAADLTLTETFVALGVDELSVSAPSILEVKAKIQETDAQEAKMGILPNGFLSKGG